MKILSLFDGMSCWQIAINKLWITDYQYLASEIDKFAIQVTQTNYPNTIQIWDIIKVRWEDYKNIDLLQWGSPCFIAWTKVITSTWYKNIEDIRVWDEVLTHKNRFKKVLKIWWNIKTIWKIKWQWFKETYTTENHPYFISKKIKTWNNSKRNYDISLSNPNSTYIKIFRIKIKCKSFI